VIPIPASEVVWLKAFFGDGNAVRWHELTTDSVRPHWAQHVLPWLKFLGETPNHKPLVLPIFNNQGPVYWYGLADSRSGLAQLTEEIRAFVGVGFSDFTGAPIVLSDVDPIEAALKTRFGALALRFMPRDDLPLGALEQQIALYAKTLARRPAACERGQRPFGNIRADFDAAVLAGNETHAKALIEELAGTGRLTAEQRQCLEIRRLAGSGNVDGLARNEGLLRGVMDLPLPPQTLVDLIGALFNTFLAPLIHDGSTHSEVLDVFRTRIANRYGSLFRERKGIREPSVLRSFLLFEAASETPDAGRCKSILDTYPEAAEGKAWAEALVAWLFTRSATGTGSRAVSSGPSIESQAKMAIGDEDYERAVTLCETLLPNAKAYQMLLRCGVESQASDLATRVEALINQAPKSVINSFDVRDQQRLERLCQLALRNQQRSLKSDWISWAQWVQQNKPPLAEAQELLKESAPTWRPEDYALHPEICERLAALIGNATRDVEGIFRVAFPDVVEFFVDRAGRPVSAFAAIYAMLIKVIAWTGAATADELQILVSILQALLETAPTSAQYKEAIDDTNDIIRANLSPNRIDWSLDLCEVLAAYPSADHEARLRAFVEVANYLRVIAHRLSIGQRLILQQLARDYGCPAIISTIPESAVEVVEQGARLIAEYSGQIAIYTLSERSAITARTALEKQVPKAKIVLNADIVCTESLKNLARNADLFVFSWKKATHAAFHCVRDIRGLENVLQPTGGGAASIVNAVVKALEENVAVA
jgi:hypothetical protein